MRTTIDQAGRVVIPKVLRDQVGLRAGPVEIRLSGSGLHVEPVGDEHVIERNGRLVIAAAAAPIGVDEVDELRRADQR